MSRTNSTMAPLGASAPDFSLPDTVSGKTVSLDSVRSKTATVVMFICNHCPYVKHVQAGLVAIAKDYMPKGVSFVAISSNDAAQYPDDSPEKMKIEAEQAGYPFPYLYDESQQVARAYDAACTPDFFVYDSSLHLAYRGQFDDSRRNSDIPVTGRDLRYALDALLSGKPVPAEQLPSLGCNIKWKG
ncbi:MAG: thioredoxin family protein [Bdellovibrionota bacterium]